MSIFIVVILETFTWILWVFLFFWVFFVVCLFFQNYLLLCHLVLFLIDDISEDTGLFHVEQTLTLLFPQIIFSDICYFWLCLLLLFIPEEDFSFLHASLYQGYLVMLKFGFSYCYAENKSEYVFIYSVDFMVMYMCYRLLWIMMHNFVLLINLIRICKLCIGMVKEWDSPILT